MGAGSSKASFPCWNQWLVACPEPQKLAKGGLPKASVLDSLETADDHFVIITFPFHMEETDIQAVKWVSRSQPSQSELTLNLFLNLFMMPSFSY